MTDRGFITLAQNNRHHDYVRMAYGLALSLKRTQSDGSGLSIIVDNSSAIPDHYRDVFDDVIELDQDDSDGDWKIHNKWQAYSRSPYRDTIMLDADMIFPTDISDWWEILSIRDMWVCTDPVNFQRRVVSNSPYRGAFDRNNLPHFYTGFTYFRKSDIAEEVFEATRLCVQNWDRIKHEYIGDPTVGSISGDLAFSCASEILGVTSRITMGGIGFPQFVHMRGGVLSDKEYLIMDDDWRKHVVHSYTDNHDIIVNNHKQLLPFHYHVKEWLTEDILTKLENSYV